MKPPADAQPLPPILSLSHHHLFDRMKAPPGLHLEKDELVPARRDRLARARLGLQPSPLLLRCGARLVQLERASPLGLPRLLVREGHVEDVRDPPGADHVVVVEQVASVPVGVHGHVLLGPGERPAAGDAPHKGPEGRRVERIPEREQGG